MALDLSKYIFIDNHAHSVLRDHLHLDVIGVRGCFTESRSMSMLESHVPYSLHYMHMLNCIQRVLGTHSEDDFISVRSRQQDSTYTRMLFDDISLGAMIVDDGFRPADMVTPVQFATLSQRPIFLCRRIEPVLEACIAKVGSFAELEDTFQKELLAADPVAPVALKTICGYRGGLDIELVKKTAAAKDFERIKKIAAKRRITRCDLYHYFVMQAFELAAYHHLPMQVHAGIGDDDADLKQCNPLLMQSLFRISTLQKTKFVLLHCYPFVREAAFLASLYANVYMDLSLALNIVSTSGQEMIAEALATAPASKILAGTDGHTCPETHWYAALCWKRALSAVLTDLVNKKMLTLQQVQQIAAMILHENANRLYKLQTIP